MGLVWTHESLERLVDIEDFNANDSTERAARFIDQLIDHTEKMLINKPGIGRVVPEIGRAEIRELIFKKYRIVYRLNENRIEILTDFEGRKLLRFDELE